MLVRYRYPSLRLATSLGLVLTSVATSAMPVSAAGESTGNRPTLAVVDAAQPALRQSDVFSSLSEKQPAADENTAPGVDQLEEPTAEPVTATDELDSSDEETNGEVIHERFSNRAVKIEREVTQDADGNYVNHGRWTQWNEQGHLVARGEYQFGDRHGKWFRWYDAKQAELFSEPAFRGFEHPFGTEAEFAEGELDGTWRVFDAKERPICTWQFEKGQRQGRSVWYSTNGQVRQEVNFKNGQMDGDLKQLDAQGKMVVREKYIEGRRLAQEVSYYSPGKKKSQGEMLYAETYADVKYDWWTGTSQVTPPPKDLVDQRHGHWTWWFANGQKQFEGRYKYDQPIGKFTWWHSNGQKLLDGMYVRGQQDGKFIWWYATGQKQREGNYALGVPIGNWMQWTVEGKIVQTEDYRSKGNSILQPAELMAQPQAAGEDGPAISVGQKSRLQR